MKKYDLFLLGLYVLLFLAMVGFVYSLFFQEKQNEIRTGAYIKELYGKPVKAVVIRDTPLDITIREVETLSNGAKHGFELKGRMWTKSAKLFKNHADTLVIAGENGAGATQLTLFLTPSVKLDTIINAPNVKR